MPFFRGIQMSIVSGVQSKKLPEYPHPDGPSVRLRSAPYGDGITTDQEGRQSSTSVDEDPTRQRKTNPRVSVYVPSTPGGQFWLQYDVSDPPPSRCIFFKMLVNGRNIVSWGIDTADTTSGVVARALYEPGERWQADVDGGPVGIETRYLYFMHGLERKSVAEDGGLIEIRVFRCKGRRRVAMRLEGYRNQERYSITSPSGGLVDNPQDATYYDYHLLDAVDEPYATFCFQYRSMKHLCQLNLIPKWPTPDQSDPALPGQGAIGDLPVAPLDGSAGTSTGPQQFAFGVESLDTRVFDNDIKSVSLAISEPSDAHRMEKYVLRSPPKLSSTSPCRSHIPDPQSIPDSWMTAEMLQRPLPEVPDDRSGRSSRSSTRSSCPSLTPSMKKFADSDEFEQEEVQLCVAKAVSIPSAPMKATEIMITRKPEEVVEGDSFSHYTTSSSFSEESASPQFPSPDGYIPTTGSVLERQLNEYGSPKAQTPPSSGSARIPQTSGSEATLVDERELPRFEALSMTEAEWLRHTPSPLKRADNHLGESWSPRPEKKNNDLLDGVMDAADAQRLSSSSRDEKDSNTAVECETRDNDERHLHMFQNRAVERPDGNWI